MPSRYSYVLLALALMSFTAACNRLRSGGELRLQSAGNVRLRTVVEYPNLPEPALLLDYHSTGELSDESRLNAEVEELVAAASKDVERRGIRLLLVRALDPPRGTMEWIHEKRFMARHSENGQWIIASGRDADAMFEDLQHAVSH